MSEEIVSIFNQFRTVICMCPECDAFSRLSDMHIRASGKTPKTWLDEFEASDRQIMDEENEFSEQEDRVRSQAVERGRAKVPNLVRQSMHSQFTKLPYDPYDIKPLLHPIDFVVFDGMNGGKVRDVVLLSRITNNPHMLSHQQSIKKVVESQSYDWKVVRVSIDGEVEIE